MPTHLIHLSAEFVREGSQCHLHPMVGLETRLELVQRWCFVQESLQLLDYYYFNYFKPETRGLRLGSNWKDL